MRLGSDVVRVATLLRGVALLLAVTTVAAAQGPRLFSREWYAQFSGPYSQPVEPFRIVGNIYYVGALNIASYLITTPQGHILIDTGTTEMHDAIVRSVEQLGYRVADIRILLASHAHFDHVEGPADTRNTFRKLKAERQPDIVLVGHPQAMFAGTVDAMRRGDRPHPLLNGAEAWTRQLAVAEADFERRVRAE